MNASKEVLRLSVGALTLSALASALAQTQQKVSGPLARYWVSAETVSGMGAMAGAQGGGGMDIMRGMSGAGEPVKHITLDLGAVRAANPATGDHFIPQGMAMGSSLPLWGEVRATASLEPAARDLPPHVEPKGRMLIFWGCGDKPGPGQPIVLDFSQMANGQFPANLRTVVLRNLPHPPGPGRDAGFAQWPNAQGKTQQVPGNASLVGDHLVKSNIAVDINFKVTEPHDFMEALNLSTQPTSSGGRLLRWNRPATALGYFATAMGAGGKGGVAGDGGGDLVMWSSSTVRMLGGQSLMDYLPPHETERLIKEQVVMPAGTTECQIPGAVVQAAGGELTMVSLNAFGPELNVVYPPRPANPKEEWKQQTLAKVRLRATTMTMPGMEQAMGQAPRRGNAPVNTGDDTPVPAPKKSGIGVGDVLKGVFGF
jgi:hypothetical protein